jgi:MYXO-CTERM domain-containing protein
MQSSSDPIRKAALPSAGVLALLLGATAAQAAITVSASDPFVTIQATSGSFSGTFTVPLGSVTTMSDPAQDVWFWTSAGAVPIFDGANLVAVLSNMTVLAGRNTQPNGEERIGIDVDFGVLAGGGDTTFTISSPTMSFSPVTGASALVSAGLVGTDQNANGITISPTAANGFGFNALFNGANVFRSYFNQTLSNVPSGSVNADGNMVPAGTFLPIGTATSMQSVYSFSVSAGDAAGGTTTYAVVPTPGGFILLGLAGLFGGRRRR